MKTFYSQTITFSFLIAIFLSSCVVSEEKESDLTDGKLKGNIKSIIDKNYYATQSFGEIEKDTSSLMSVSEKEYNKSGNLIMYKKTAFNPDNDPSSFTQYTYLYNEKQEHVESIEYNDVGRKVSSSINIYDETGNNIKTTNYEDGAINNVYKKKYNKNNQLESKQHYNAGGDASISYSYEYDNLGNNIEEIVFYADGDLMYTYKRKYDIHNNIIEEIKYDDSGAIIQQEEYQYDKEGSLMLFYSEIKYTEEGEDYWSMDYEYDEVDDQGNWITVKKTSSKKFYSLMNRKIEYY